MVYIAINVAILTISLTPYKIILFFVIAFIILNIYHRITKQDPYDPF